MELLREQEIPFDATACRGAASFGQLEPLKWLREQGCPWGVSACTAAAGDDQLSNLIWLMENGCPVDEGAFAAATDPDTIAWLQDHNFLKKAARNKTFRSNFPWG